MTKQQFVKTMTKLKELHDASDEISKAMKKLSPDFGGFSNEKAETLVIRTLEIAMDDRFNWISYYIYELEWGEKYKTGCVQEKDGSNIKLKTFEDLYELIKS